MYFVTTSRKGYILFTMTARERGAVGLTEAQMVHFLVKGEGGDWHVVHEWDGRKYSHTDFMGSLHRIPEPEDPRDLLDQLPPELRAKA
ncbi:MAG TPA: hypothetical protein VEB21_20100 [Terriglobales bacterium]|nr:hypothetical protein [Terriglobales bacterium]